MNSDEYEFSIWLFIQGDPKKTGPAYTLCDFFFIYSPIVLILLDMAESTTVSTPRPQWELGQRIYCVKFYYKTSSFKKTQDSFMHQFECEKAPSKSRIQNWVDHFEKYGTVENLNAASENRPGHSGRPKKRTAELVESVRESLQESPKRYGPQNLQEWAPDPLPVADEQVLVPARRSKFSHLKPVSRLAEKELRRPSDQSQDWFWVGTP